MDGCLNQNGVFFALVDGVSCIWLAWPCVAWQPKAGAADMATSSAEVKTVDVVVEEKSLDPKTSLNPEHHHPTAEDVKAKAFYELEQSKKEHQTLISKQLERADTFQVGMRFLHDIHGPGEVVEILEDGRRRIQFDNGASHAYKPSSIHKLKPIVDDAHTFTPACAATP